jgi:hypothetical protein
MAYGEIKVDTVTFTDGGIDKSVSISGLVQNPTFSGNITVTGTISGNTVQGQTVSGATVTGTTANFVSGVFTTQISGATITGNVGSFTTITGGTVTLTSGVFASGTAAAPSVSIGTTDNGLYSPGTDQVAVATNGTGQLFISSLGNIGIGAASPSAWSYGGNIAMLGAGRYIASTSDDIRFASNVYTSDVERYAANGFATRYRMSDGTHQWATAVTGTANNAIAYNESMRITAAGLVGIGTSSVNALLEVNNSTAGGEVQRIEGNYDGSGSVTLTNWRRAGGSVAAALKYNDDSSPLCMSIGTTTSHEFRIRTADTDAITIDASQRVGIGTSAPGSRLEIGGDASYDATITFNRVPAHTSNDGVIGELFFQNNADSVALIAVKRESAADDAYIQFATQQTTGGLSEKVRITSAGLVGIGTSAPQSQLQVLDQIRISNSTQAQGSIVLGDGGSTAFNVGIARWNINTGSFGAGGIGYFSQGTGNVGGHYFYTGDAAVGSQTARMVITPGGLVGIGTTSPSTALDVSGAISLGAVAIPSAGTARIFSRNTDNNLYIQTGSGSAINLLDASQNTMAVFEPTSVRFQISNSEKARIDASGRLLVGTSTAFTSATGNAPYGKFATVGATTDPTAQGIISIGKGAAASSNLNGATLGEIYFTDNVGSPFAVIQGWADAATANDDYPGRLVFSTTADGASSPTERLRITSAGLVGIGISSPGANLHVAGASASALIEATGGTTADFLIGDGTVRYYGIRGVAGGGSLQIRNHTANTTLATFTSTGNVGIGTTSPGELLSVYGNVSILSSNRIKTTDSGGNLTIQGGGTFPGGHIILNGGNGSDNIIFNRSGASASTVETARIDSSGRLLVGTSSVRTTGWTTQGAGEIFQELTNYGGITCFTNSTNEEGTYFTLGKSRGTAVGSNTIVQNNDRLGGINFQGADGSASISAAFIHAFVDGTPGANDMPGRLVFSTTADGASSPTERMRITSGGDFLFGKTTTVASDNGAIIGTLGQSFSVASQGFQGSGFHRNGDDGGIIGFFQDGTQEGSISVSGGTVSYNGAHLSRWSQLASGAERIEILRGSVLSNLDEMCEWGEEENEQLNRMKMSDVEGDKNVSGVFQAWDDDDDTYINDFYCAMTGDFIIRIGDGVTVERGDLLMSAGDGTAKPQDDDIIRSKTIAKVTSTNVSCTYDDGSYCVPCVLMAC